MRLSRCQTSLKTWSPPWEDRVAQRTFELEAANQELQRLSNLDSLTQIGKPTPHFDQYLDQEWLRLRRETGTARAHSLRC